MRNPWNNLLLLIGALHGGLRYQLIHWPHSIRPPLRFVLMLLCSLVVAIPATLVNQLPTDWYDILIENIGDPRAAFIAFYLAMLFVLAGLYSVAADKLRRSL